MDWERLLNEFRALGGTAENIRLADGPFGRGLFVVDPSIPMTVFAPEKLLVPARDVEVRDGRLTVAANSVLGERERAFFLDYHQHFGWGAGLSDELALSQLAWSRLSPAIVAAINGTGALEDPGCRFLPPSTDTSLYQFIRSRYFTYREGTYIVPIVELANHASGALGYNVENGIGIAGTFESEVLVRYSLGDSWARVLNWGFSDRAIFAHSIPITVEAHGRKLSIKREINRNDMIGGVRFPQVMLDGDTIVVPFLTLGFTVAPDLPRAVFRKVMKPYFTELAADNVFDGIAHFNRLQFLNVLRTIRTDPSPLARTLEEAATNQLETLSYCVGARVL
jgi:hypothetical protein